MEWVKIGLNWREIVLDESHALHRDEQIINLITELIVVG